MRYAQHGMPLTCLTCMSGLRGLGRVLMHSLRFCYSPMACSPGAGCCLFVFASPGGGLYRRSADGAVCWMVWTGKGQQNRHAAWVGHNSIPCPAIVPSPQLEWGENCSVPLPLQIVGFVPTGWMYEMKKALFGVRRKGACSVHLVPYR
jgi:hypothetical protein